MGDYRGCKLLFLFSHRYHPSGELIEYCSCRCMDNGDSFLYVVYLVRLFSCRCLAYQNSAWGRHCGSAMDSIPQTKHTHTDKCRHHDNNRLFHIVHIKGMLLWQRGRTQRPESLVRWQSRRWIAQRRNDAARWWQHGRVVWIRCEFVHRQQIRSVLSEDLNACQ